MAEDRPVVRITQQFRERGNMAYDLDCAGTRLTVRIFPPNNMAASDPAAGREAHGEELWRVEARITDAPGAVVGSASGATRTEAFREVATWWASQQGTLGLPSFDWDAIAKAMTAVRAL